MGRLFLSLALCAVGPATEMCEQESVTTEILKDLTVTTCEEFNPTGPAIRLPADTSTVVYGVFESMETGGFGPPPVPGGALGDLRLRDNTVRPLNGLVVGTFIDSFTKTGSMLADDRAQLLVKVTFNETKLSDAGPEVLEMQPVLFLPKATVVKAFRGMTFTGQIYNHEPSVAGVNTYDSVTMQFGSIVADIALIGTRTSSLGEYSSDALQWYTDKFGLQGNVSLTWFPGMHAPGDSELVLHTPANMGSGFMSGIATTPEFLSHTVSEVVQKSPSWVFTVHGNPMYTLQNINGTFTEPAGTTTTTTTPTTAPVTEVSRAFITSSKTMAILAVSAIATILNAPVLSNSQ